MRKLNWLARNSRFHLKNQGYLLSVELKEICEKLRLDVRARINMVRRISDPRRIYIVLPVSDDRHERVILDADSFSESLQFEAEYQNCQNPNW